MMEIVNLDYSKYLENDSSTSGNDLVLSKFMEQTCGS